MARHLRGRWRTAMEFAPRERGREAVWVTVNLVFCVSARRCARVGPILLSSGMSSLAGMTWIATLAPRECD